MQTEQKPRTKFTQSLTFKGLMIGLMTFFLLIPGCMVQELIRERQQTRNEAVQKIDAKWSYAQTLSGPVLSVPYTYILIQSSREAVIEEVLNITPETLDIATALEPEERYYGIYKTVLYKSSSVMKGVFPAITADMFPAGATIHWDRAHLRMGVSDLRGISENIPFMFNGSEYSVQTSAQGSPATLEYDNANSLRMSRDEIKVLRIDPDTFTPDVKAEFVCTIDLKGSESINYLPVGRTTSVSVSGAWQDPGFIGNYTPEYTIGDEGFKAEWKVLKFNRSIPDAWKEGGESVRSASFGVNLVDPVDIYQQNMRSSKYALMFIALTFVIFFFVEVIGRKRIHPVQYLLVGVALILFYSLLLSISEPLGFGWAYIISSAATIGLITAYAGSIFKNRKLTLTLMLILTVLYVFMYVILQLEQVALLAGSVGLFLILGIIMYFSRRINWYSEEE